MADVLPSDLVNSVMAKLYDVLTNGDDTVPQSEDNFFSWAAPGIPVEEDDFNFLSQGLTGVVKKSAIDEMRSSPQPSAGSGVGAVPDPAVGPAARGDTPTATATAAPPSTGGDGPTPSADASQPELTPALLEQLRAQDTAQLYMQAENFARLVDFVPDVAKSDNDQFVRLSVLNNEGSLSDIYRYILRMSQVMESELPPETKAKIEKFRALLSVTKKKKNLVDDTETDVSEPSPLSQAYFEKMAAYENAALEYNAHRIDALTASDARAVHYWAINANILRNRVRAAMSDWVSNGYKNDYEQISAFIDQVMQRDMALLKQEYRDELERARLTGLASGSDFFYTALTPGNFTKALGWTEFTFSSGDFERHTSTQYSTRRWKTSGSAGFLGIGATAGKGGSRTHQEYHSKFNSDNFHLEFEICQVPIVRPWFKQAFLLSKSWRFDVNNPEAKNEIVSDGATPPKGLIPAYATAAVFVRNLKLTLGHSEGFSDFVASGKSSSVGGGGFVNFGPFFAGGSYSRSSASGESQRDFGVKWDNQGMEVPGTQVAGFKCHIMPKSPNPLPTITKWI